MDFAEAGDLHSRIAKTRELKERSAREGKQNGAFHYWYITSLLWCGQRPVSHGQSAGYRAIDSIGWSGFEAGQVPRAADPPLVHADLVRTFRD